MRKLLRRTLCLALVASSLCLVRPVRAKAAHGMIIGAAVCTAVVAVSALIWKGISSSFEYSTKRDDQDILSNAAMEVRGEIPLKRVVGEDVGNFTEFARKIQAEGGSVTLFINQLAGKIENLNSSLAKLKSRMEVWKNSKGRTEMYKEGVRVLREGETYRHSLRALHERLAPHISYFALFDEVQKPMMHDEGDFPLVSQVAYLEKRIGTLEGLIKRLENKNGMVPAEMSMLSRARQELGNLVSLRQQLIHDPRYNQQLQMSFEERQSRELIEIKRREAEIHERAVRASEEVARSEKRKLEELHEQNMLLERANRFKAEELRYGYAQKIRELEVERNRLRAEVARLKRENKKIDIVGQAGRASAAHLERAVKDLSQLEAQITDLKRKAENPPMNPEAGGRCYEWLKNEVMKLGK
ncbi:MAG: hypothetical protein JW725_01090 [Candidatus Babeliaceae bacterium]|nr:hypothetical protein [Candidatus Babeliaceae bacterium]